MKISNVLSICCFLIILILPSCDLLFPKEKVSDPIIFPHGDSFTDSVTITIGTSTENANIRYTVDNSNPTDVLGEYYTLPIIITNTTTIKAIAFKEGMENSNIALESYIFIPKEKVSKPIMFPHGNNFTDSVTIIIETSTEGASIRYTIDNSDPSNIWGEDYTSPVTITNSTTLKAIALKEGMENSDIALESYIITLQDYDLPILLPKTGQNFSFAPGDDGELQKGISWPDRRFINNQDGTVTDNLTGLMWERVKSDTLRTWQEALNYCNNLPLAGYTDWRLPNRNELRSLVNYNYNVRYLTDWLNTQGFSGMQSTDSYWSSTTYTLNTNYAWYMYMPWDGYILNTEKTTLYYVFAVRGNQAGIIKLPKTGQSISYAAGDDGDVLEGVSWPQQRFINNNDGTITDYLTGLIWERVPLATIKTWPEALDYCNNLELANYTEWRLPNINELESLIHQGVSNPATWLNGQGFEGIVKDFYWSSTTYTNTNTAWNINMDDGIVGERSKTPYYIYVLAVH